MKSGAWVGIGLLALAAIGGIAAYALQSFVYYEEVSGLETVEIGGRAFAVSDYQGLDNPTLPLRLRGCFQIADPEGALNAAPPAEKPEPFDAPGWFECWEPERLDADLIAGRAQAVLAETAGEGEFATERVVAIYPDGRAYQWRRLANP